MLDWHNFNREARHCSHTLQEELNLGSRRSVAAMRYKDPCCTALSLARGVMDQCSISHADTSSVVKFAMQ
jgi:hypothetical protein